MKRVLICILCLVGFHVNQSNAARRKCPTSLKKVILDQPFTIEGRNQCADPILPLLLSDQSKKFYGCCNLKKLNDSSENCCLLAGSACDILYTRSPRPCKGAPCCPVDKVDDKPYSIVRASAGSVFDINLRRLMRYYVNEFRFRGYQGQRIKNYVALKDNPVDDMCVDRGGYFKIGKVAKFMNLEFRGCCRRAPTSPAQSTEFCCLNAFSPCNGGIDCCRNTPCYLGKCTYAAGRAEEPFYQSKTSICGYQERYDKHPYDNYPVRVTATGKCQQPGLPILHNFTSNSIPNYYGRTLIGCCRKRHFNGPAEIRSDCCMLEGSYCDNTVNCCAGQVCCGNVCSISAGTREDVDLINYPEPLC